MGVITYPCPRWVLLIEVPGVTTSPALTHCHGGFTKKHRFPKQQKMIQSTGMSPWRRMLYNNTDTLSFIQLTNLFETGGSPFHIQWNISNETRMSCLNTNSAIYLLQSWWNHVYFPCRERPPVSRDRIFQWSLYAGFIALLIYPLVPNFHVRFSNVIMMKWYQDFNLSNGYQVMGSVAMEFFVWSMNLSTLKYKYVLSVV